MRVIEYGWDMQAEDNKSLTAAFVATLQTKSISLSAFFSAVTCRKVPKPLDNDQPFAQLWVPTTHCGSELWKSWRELSPCSTDSSPLLGRAFYGQLSAASLDSRTSAETLEIHQLTTSKIRP